MSFKFTDWNRFQKYIKSYQIGDINIIFKKNIDIYMCICYYVIMRTTIELPDEILKKAKIKAVQEGISLKQLFTRDLEKELDPEPESKLVVPLKPKVDNSFRSSLKTGKTGSLKASKSSFSTFKLKK